MKSSQFTVLVLMIHNLGMVILFALDKPWWAGTLFVTTLMASFSNKSAFTPSDEKRKHHESPNT